MISKSKILLYSIFKRSRPAPELFKKLNFFEKLVLLQVGRFKSYNEIKDITYFEWTEAKQHAKKHYKWASIIIGAYIGLDIFVYRHRLRYKQAEKAYEKRIGEGLDDFPRYKPYGKNPYWDMYDIHRRSPTDDHHRFL